MSDPIVGASNAPTATPRRPLPSAALAGIIAVVMAVGGVFGLQRGADGLVGGIQRIDALAGALSVTDDSASGILGTDGPIGPTVNFLLVGSDSRDGISSDDPNFGAIGSTSDVSGERADTIMILRRESDGGLALTSLPRDLLVEIADTGQRRRINSAYSGGPDRLVRTVTQSLGIPIHHYVEVDFQGFQEIIDATGGVELCIEYATRDRNSGLDLQPGCQRLNGSQALAFARSRYYEEFRDGQWRRDGSADLGRIARQQLFMRAAMNGALASFQADPLASGRLLESVVDSVRVDPGLDPFRAAESLRRAAGDDLVTYALPVRPTTVNGASVVELEPAAEEILEYFRGLGPAPALPED
jgi:LCP family protein required for cell wall assembly